MAGAFASALLLLGGRSFVLFILLIQLGNVLFYIGAFLCFSALVAAMLASRIPQSLSWRWRLAILIAGVLSTAFTAESIVAVPFLVLPVPAVPFLFCSGLLGLGIRWQPRQQIQKLALGSAILAAASMAPMIWMGWH